jgi:hypothetical protein
MIRQGQVSRFVGAVLYTAACSAACVTFIPSAAHAQSLSLLARADSLLAAANAQLTRQPKQKAVATKQAQMKSATARQAADRLAANGIPRAGVGTVSPASPPVTPPPEMRRRSKH